MKVPTSFDLMGKTYEVKFDSKLDYKENTIGQVNFLTGLITLQSNSESTSLCEDEINKVFFHELMHAVFHELSLKDSQNDEVLVDQVGGLIYQYFKTAKFE